MRAEELHDLLVEASADVPVVDPVTARSAMRARMRRNQVQRLGAVAAVVLVLVGVVALLVDRSGRNEVFVGTEAPRLIPDPVPESLVPAAISDHPRDLGTPGTAAADVTSRYWLWRPDGALDWSEGILVSLAQLPDGFATDEDPGRVEVAGALITGSRIEGDLAIGVMGRGQDEAAIGDLLASLHPTGPHDLGEVAVPDGYEVVVDGVSFDPVDEGLAGADGHSALWSDGADDRARMLLVLTATGPDVAASQEILTFTLSGPAEPVSVGGIDAMLYHQDPIVAGRSTAAEGLPMPAMPAMPAVPVPVVVWRRDGVLVRVQGWGFTDEEALAIAASLRPATDAEWQAMQQAAASSAQHDGPGQAVDPGSPTTVP